MNKRELYLIDSQIGQLFYCLGGLSAALHDLSTKLHHVIPAVIEEGVSSTPPRLPCPQAADIQNACMRVDTFTKLVYSLNRGLK